MSVSAAPELAAEAELLDRLEAQRRAFMKDGVPTASLRRDRIQRLIDMLMLNAQDFADAMAADFGTRSHMQSMATDLMGVLPSLKSDLANVSRWMKPRRASSGPFAWAGASSRIEYIPRGVVGIVSAWNFPLALAVMPLSQAFAAGNRAMVKVSELTPQTSALFARLVAQWFDPAEVTVVTGGPQVGAAFTALPFDLMFFTGATSVGRHVMAACAANLVPCVLELGGKSPAVISDKADIAMAARRVAIGKLFNAGQACVAPDYVLVEQSVQQRFVAAYQDAVISMFPTLLNNDDYTAIINARQQSRILGYLDDARERGATVIEINPAGEVLDGSHKIVPSVVLDCTPMMKIMQDEIFGPILPIINFTRIEEAIAHINAGDRPLAAYYFGKEDADCRKFMAGTWSGGVSINDVLLHVSNDHLPFGGIGASGLGSYHGKAGFETFSHARPIMRSGWISPIAFVAPPYGPHMRNILAWYLGRLQRQAGKRLDKRSGTSPSSRYEK